MSTSISRKIAICGALIVVLQVPPLLASERVSASARTSLNRGNAWFRKGRFDKAIADYTAAIRINPKYTLAYRNRGVMWYLKGEYEIAIADFTSAIRLDPKDFKTFTGRGLAWVKKGEYDKATADYTTAIRLNPKFAMAYNYRAWLYATCKDSRVRNGRQAVVDATKGCELTKWSNASYIDTLAAAYAETGDFNQAVKWQTKAVELAPAKDKTDYRSCLTLYQADKPYRAK